MDRKSSGSKPKTTATSAREHIVTVNKKIYQRSRYVVHIRVHDGQDLTSQAYIWPSVPRGTFHVVSFETPSSSPKTLDHIILLRLTGYSQKQETHEGKQRRLSYQNISPTKNHTHSHKQTHLTLNMCQINIIHFSHPEAQATSNPSNPSSSSIVAALNLLPTRLTTDEFLSKTQPPHEFAICPTHINNKNSCCCVAYKQTMPCLLWKLHSSDVANNINSGVNASECPSLSVTHEHHPLSLLIPLQAPQAPQAPAAPFKKSESLTLTTPPIPARGSQESLSQARTSLLSTADEIHKQKLTLDRTIVEVSELMELLFLELAEACATTFQPLRQQHQQEPAAKRHAFFVREFERPLNRCAELCQKIREADEKIGELFKTFVQKRKGMGELVVAFERKNKECSSTVQELAGCDVYPVGKAREVLRELSTANVAEVCEGSVRRGRELREEMVRLLEGVERFMQPVQRL